MNTRLAETISPAELDCAPAHAAAAGGWETAMDRKQQQTGTDAPRPEVSFFCPAYLDQDNVARVVRRGVATLARCTSAYEWIIVNDGSPDRTGAVADALAAEFGPVRVAHHDSNRGHGAALKTGFALARGEWAGFCDGDDQYDPRDLALFLAHCGHADVIIGRRTSYPNGPARAFLSAALNAGLRWLFGTPFRDLGCAFKLFRTDTLTCAKARSNGIFTQCEMVLRAHRAGLRIVEVPVPAYPRVAGRSSSLRMSNISAMIRDIAALFREFYLL